MSTSTPIGPIHCGDHPFTPDKSCATCRALGRFSVAEPHPDTERADADRARLTEMGVSFRQGYMLGGRDTIAFLLRMAERADADRRLAAMDSLRLSLDRESAKRVAAEAELERLTAGDNEVHADCILAAHHLLTERDEARRLMAADFERADAAEERARTAEEKFDAHMKWTHLTYACPGVLIGGFVCRNGTEREGERCTACAHIAYLADTLAAERSLREAAERNEARAVIEARSAADSVLRRAGLVDTTTQQYRTDMAESVRAIRAPLEAERNEARADLATAQAEVERLDGVIVDLMHSASAEATATREVVARVRALHVIDDQHDAHVRFCAICCDTLGDADEYPCATIRALDSTPSGEATT